MNRFKNGCRAIAFVLLLSMASMTLTGCNAAGILDFIQQVIPVVSNIISGIKGIIDQFKGSGSSSSGSGNTNSATGTSSISSPGSSTPSNTAIKEGDDAEAIPNSDKE
ncbi:MAG: hypothetical protein OZSIB_1784 [Candidatus Ozemobacter sibiricus]|uniref:Lipoprotein n=1 Tax=Candidatus Ozemobacter sibiricus TaxID=2268124 RepID=A0A367ZJ44_9BACT|nr:MAG: hypothetical protein OZSIB_1784 [Candidatus Ozemobacter sibiricus]